MLRFFLDVFRHSTPSDFFAVYYNMWRLPARKAIRGILWRRFRGSGCQFRLNPHHQQYVKLTERSKLHKNSLIANREQLARTVDVEGGIDVGGGDLRRLALNNPPGLLDLSVVNGTRWRAAEIPAVNGHGTAMAVARFYAGLIGGGELDGVRLVSADTVAAMTAGELTARDVVVGEEITWGLGVWVDNDGFGMGGLGGSLGMADPALGVAEAYVTRYLAGYDRAEAVDTALRAALQVP